MAHYTLGIESSCDETAAAVVEEGRIIRSNIIASQIPIHQKYGGVVPEIASRHHVEQILPVIIEALEVAQVTLEDIQEIGVTYGPGLVGALLVGVAAAKGLAYATDKPLIGVNHMEGHIFANFLSNPALEPPFLSLVVSGGHTMLVAVHQYDSFEVLGQTRDDAAGESFDKVARVLGYSYPGGPHVEALAKKGDPFAIPFPKALMEKGNLEFSFSGLKSAVLNYMNRASMKQETFNPADVAASFQRTVIEVLVEKTREAVKQTGLTTVTLAGGVSANRALQEGLRCMCEQEGYSFYTPSALLYTDNAAMIACRAYYLSRQHRHSSLTLNAKPALCIGDEVGV